MDTTFPILDFEQLGERLRAYRLGAGLRAEQVAGMLGISRAAVYRMEKGEIVKIDTLAKLAATLKTSLPSLMGVETEFHVSAISYMERMRQLEVGATRIMAHFDPISVLLTTDRFEYFLDLMLRESRESAKASDIDELISLLVQRKQSFAANPIPVMSLIGLQDLERFVYFGFVGRMGLPTPVKLERVIAARKEVERIADLMESAPEDFSIGVLEQTMPSSTFQVFDRPGGSCVAMSPYRFANFPNITSGIASVTYAPEAVALYTQLADDLWAKSLRGSAGAAAIRSMLNEV